MTRPPSEASTTVGRDDQADGDSRYRPRRRTATNTSTTETSTATDTVTNTDGGGDGEEAPSEEPAESAELAPTARNDG